MKKERESMKNKSTQLWKSLMAKALIVVMVMMSVLVIPATDASAAAAPKLNKSTNNIVVGKKYDFNILNKIKGSTYEWTTSNKKVATVDKKGVVTGVAKGTAVIKCKVKAPKKTYTLSAKVTIIEPAKRVKISNKITTINVGETYDLNRLLIPSTSNEKTTWKSSDTSIAAPDKNGKFTALKVGTVTITAKTTTGKTDSVTISVVEGAASTQDELNSLLKTGAKAITIKTDKEVNLTIPAGDYSKTKLVVEAPKADITNYGVFASIDIKEIKADTWREEAVGNLLNILAAKSRVVVGQNAKCSIEVNEEGATLVVENNGVIEKITISKEAAQASLDIKGSSASEVPVVVNVPNVKITTSVPLNLELEEKVELTILPGAEKTQVTAKTEDAVPVVKGDVKLEVKVGSGDSAKVVDVVGTPIPTTAPSAPAQGGNPGSVIGGDTYTGSVTADNGTYTLSASYKKLVSINVNYAGFTYTVDSAILGLLQNYLGAEESTLKLWKNTVDTTKVYSGQEVRVTGVKGNNTKTVTFTENSTHLGLLGRSFEVTVNDNGSVTVVSPLTQNAYTISKGSDEKTLTISDAPAGLTFTNPVFKY
jgi:hypothetical protein